MSEPLSPRASARARAPPARGSTPSRGAGGAPAAHEPRAGRADADAPPTPGASSADELTFPLPHTYEYAAAGESSKFQRATLPPWAAPPPVVARHIVFLLDATGSMQPYLTTAKHAIARMMAAGTAESEGTNGGRGAEAHACTLVFFRDHCDAWIIRQVGPTCELRVLLGELAAMTATGGGDTPEAAAEALRAAADAIRRAAWGNAATMVVAITDAPPHGLASGADCYPEGGPEGALVDIMAQCDALADLNARLVTVIAGRAAGSMGYDVNTVWRALSARASPHDAPIVVPLEAEGHAAAMLCALVTGVAASEAEDAAVVERIAALEAALLVAHPALPESERDEAVARMLAEEGRHTTVIETDAEAAYDADVAAALAATPSVAAARAALLARGFGSGGYGYSGAFGAEKEEAGARPHASTQASRIGLERSPMTSHDVRRSKGKGATPYALRLHRAMTVAAPINVAALEAAAAAEGGAPAAAALAAAT